MNNTVKGDMPGDKIEIDATHIKRAEKAYPFVQDAHEKSGKDKYVISIYGGSGVGKSEIGSLLATRFIDAGIGVYLLSGDNYPYRIPCRNDSERLKRYREGGRRALKNYLGTAEEIDFNRINGIISKFKKGDPLIELKRMGRTDSEISFENIDFSAVSLLIIEWTHGNNSALEGVDYPLYLFSTPDETLAHRMSRGRDKGTDSPFVSLVLDMEQEKLNNQAETARLILSRSAEILNLDQLKERMG